MTENVTQNKTQAVVADGVATRTGDENKIKSPEGFNRPDYLVARKHMIDIIPSVSILDAIDRYIGHVALGLFGFGISKMLTKERGMRFNAIKDPWVIGSMLGGLATAILGIYAHYKKRKIAEPVHITYHEKYKIEETRMFGQSLADALEAKFPHGHCDKEHTTAAQADATKQWVSESRRDDSAKPIESNRLSGQFL